MFEFYAVYQKKTSNALIQKLFGLSLVHLDFDKRPSKCPGGQKKDFSSVGIDLRGDIFG